MSIRCTTRLTLKSGVFVLDQNAKRVSLRRLFYFRTPRLVILKDYLLGVVPGGCTTLQRARRLSLKFIAQPY